MTIFLPLGLLEKEKPPSLKENIQKCGSGSGPADQNKCGSIRIWIRIRIHNSALKYKKNDFRGLHTVKKG
jgi:hypothetical protein